MRAWGWGGDEGWVGGKRREPGSISYNKEYDGCYTGEVQGSGRPGFAPTAMSVGRFDGKWIEPWV